MPVNGHTETKTRNSKSSTQSKIVNKAAGEIPADYSDPPRSDVGSIYKAGVEVLSYLAEPVEASHLDDPVAKIDCQAAPPEPPLWNPISKEQVVVAQGHAVSQRPGIADGPALQQMEPSPMIGSGAEVHDVAGYAAHASVVAQYAPAHVAAAPAHPQVAPSLLRCCALQAVELQSLSELQLATSDRDLAAQLMQLLGNIEVLSAECDLIFFTSVSVRVGDAAAVADGTARLQAPQLHEITQRLIFRLGCRDPDVLQRIGDVFAVTASGHEASGGIGPLEFRGYVASLLTQALREFGSRLEMLEMRPGGAEDQMLQGQAPLPQYPPMSAAEPVNTEVEDGGSFGDMLASAGAGLSVLTAGLRGVRGLPRQPIDVEESTASVEATQRAAAHAAAMAEVQRQAKAATAHAAAMPDDEPMTGAGLGFAREPRPVPQEGGLGFAPEPRPAPNNGVSNGGQFRLSPDHQALPQAAGVLPLDEPAEVPDREANYASAQQASVEPGDVSAAADGSSWTQRVRSAHRSFLNTLDSLADRFDTVFAPKDGQQDNATDLPMQGDGPSLASDSDKADGQAPVLAGEPRAARDEAALRRAEARVAAAKAAVEEADKLAKATEAAAAAAWQQAPRAVQEQGHSRVYAPNAREAPSGFLVPMPDYLEREAKRLVKHDGLPAYAYANQTWIDRRVFLTSDQRFLYILEDEGHPSEILSESPYFRIADLRKVTRRTSPGNHVLSLHFEEGTLVLRFSYREFLNALIAVLIADRRLPVVEGSWD